MLKIQVKDEEIATPSVAAWIVDEMYSIGSDPSNDLVIEHPSVSASHAQLVTIDKQLFIKDNNSKFGVYVNGERVIETAINPGDAISLGRVELSIIDTLNPEEAQEATTVSDGEEWALVSSGPWMPGKRFPVGLCAWIVGRDDGCDIMLPSKRISRRHAELSRDGNYLHVTDLASRNGTFINDVQISSGVLQPGDKIHFGSFLFEVAGPSTEVDDDRTLLQKPTPPLATYKVKNAEDNAPEEKSIAERDEEFRASVSVEENVEPAEKRWKTRPTSPGNRVVEIPPEKNHWWNLLTSGAVILALGTLGYIAYLLIFQFDRLI